MESPLLQRIVGAAVLVALGVIFIPALLDGSGYRSRQVQDIRIKEKPAFPPLSHKQVKPLPVPFKKTEKSSDKTSSSGTRGHGRSVKPIHAFALQVGTFHNNENAEKLRDKLRKAGYASFVVPVVEKDRKTYRVRIGPELEKFRLLQINKKIKKKFKLDGYVVNHP